MSNLQVQESDPACVSVSIVVVQWLERWVSDIQVLGSKSYLCQLALRGGLGVQRYAFHHLIYGFSFLVRNMFSKCHSCEATNHKPLKFFIFTNMGLEKNTN